jgi:hypothetical protein
MKKLKQATNEFLLPDELGWQCNDEISDYIDTWIKNFIKHSKDSDTQRELYILMEISKAELMDNIYAIIKKYQNEANTKSTK